MTWPGIEHRSPGPLTNTLPTRPPGKKLFIYEEKLALNWKPFISKPKNRLIHSNFLKKKVVGQKIIINEHLPFTLKRLILQQSTWENMNFTLIKIISLVWFICFMARQLFIGYLMPAFLLISKCLLVWGGYKIMDELIIRTKDKTIIIQVGC